MTFLMNAFCLLTPHIVKIQIQIQLPPRHTASSLPLKENTSTAVTSSSLDNVTTTPISSPQSLIASPQRLSADQDAKVWNIF